jgi:hypothetical protein
MFPRVVERHLRPALLRQREIDAGIGQIHQVAVEVLGRLERVGAGELGEVDGVRAGGPARGVGAGILDRAVDAVLGLEPPSCFSDP